MYRGQLENVAFSDAERLLEALGFVYVRTSGSHRIYQHGTLPIIVNVQPERGDAKAYQLRQLLRVIERYHLLLEDRP